MNTTAVLDRDTEPTPTSSLASLASSAWSDFGCRVNALPPAELFERYERSRFLYPAKRARLAPYWPRILDNWQRARRAGELLHWVASYDEPDGGWASLTSWRSTHAGWQTQHLVSSGTLLGGRAVMLAAQAVRTAERQDVAQQNWFSPGNRFAALAFGGMADSLGPERSLVAAGDYVTVPLPLARTLGQGDEARGPGGDGARGLSRGGALGLSGDGALGLSRDGTRGLGRDGTRGLGGDGTRGRDRRPSRPVVELDGGACPELAELARHCRGEVYVRAEGLDRDDLRLDDVDRLYRLVGLRRYRRIWVQYDATGRLRAAALAYRGPLGFNFSFLENRCDLLVSPELEEPEARRAIDALIGAASAAYEDFEPGSVPVAAATPLDRLLLAGAERVRPYTRALWLAEAYSDLYQHIDSLYARRLRGRGQHPRRTP
ncbi:hypothetical protein OG462_14845 [Streptomyces sp. NBC_01077]|uniref:hypothetical protein n=1 Tax=Streptomyces sp. NBC_01077 TaxID=2903746 RepID=UPI00386FA9AD|nr:hypothetical protein OG462_14845 [Streptomyces sp. NBC_01077]